MADEIPPLTDELLNELIAQGRAEMEAEQEGEWEDEYPNVVVIRREGPGLLVIESDLEDDEVAAILSRAFVQFNQTWETQGCGGDENYEEEDD